MHTAAVDAEDGLGHEGGMKSVLLGQRLNGQLEGHDVIGGGQSLGVLEVDLMLTGGHLVVGSLDFEAHLFQRHADFPASAFAVIQRAQIKVTGFVVGGGGGLALFIRLEQEELALRAYVEAVAHISRLLQHPLQRAPGIAHERRAVGIVHIADQAGHLALLGPPGQYGESIQIRTQVLVGFLDAHKALDGAAVDHDLIIDRLLDLRSRNGHVLQLTKNIGKLHTDKLHIVLMHHPNDVILAVPAHDETLLKNKQSKACRTQHPCSAMRV